MSETRRQLFKTSLLSVFGLALAGSLAKADTDLGGQLVLVRAVKDRNPVNVLLRFESGGDISAFVVEPSGGASPKPDDLQMIFSDGRYKVKVVAGTQTYSVQGVTSTFKVKNGMVHGGFSPDLTEIMTSKVWNEIVTYRQLPPPPHRR